MFLRHQLLQILLITPKSSRPVADSADRVEAETFGADVRPADQVPGFLSGAGDELLAGRRVGEVADVQAFDGACGKIGY